LHAHRRIPTTHNEQVPLRPHEQPHHCGKATGTRAGVGRGGLRRAAAQAAPSAWSAPSAVQGWQHWQALPPPPWVALGQTRCPELAAPGLAWGVNPPSRPKHLPAQSPGRIQNTTSTRAAMTWRTETWIDEKKGKKRLPAPMTPAGAAARASHLKAHAASQICGRILCNGAARKVSRTGADQPAQRAGGIPIQSQHWSCACDGGRHP
jgi:hypothetical protein